MLPPACFRTLAEVALATGRPYRTIQTWAHRLQIRTVWDIKKRRLLVSLTDAHRLARTAEDRTHRAA